MKPQKLLCLCLAFLAMNSNCWSAAPVSILPASSKMQPADNTRLFINDQIRVAQMKRFVGMTAGEYGQLRGKKLNFFERVSFRLSQHRMKRMLRSYDGDGPTTFEKISWLFKGLLFGPIALILGYILLKDDDRELIKWIWFGFIGFAAFIVLILLM